MRSRYFVAAVATAAVLLIAACGSNSNNSNTASSVNTANGSGAVATVASAARGSSSSVAGTQAAASNLPQCPPSGSAQAITGAGSTFDAPLFSKLFDLYNQQCKVQVNYQSVGSGAGIEQLIKKTVTFGATDAPMTDEQIRAAGGDVLHIPVTLGAVPIGYNLPGVKSGIKLNGDVLAKIFLGTIKKWNDPTITGLNPGMKLPDLDISVVHRSDGSGTTFIFTNYLSAVSPDWKSKVGSGTSVNWPVGAGAKGSEGVAGIVKQTPGSVGYFELAYAVQNNITSATMQNAAGKFVAPTSEGASAAAANSAGSVPADLRAVITNPPGDGAYPISGFSWVVINQTQSDAKVAQSIVYLLQWVTHAGQQYANALSYAALPSEIQQLDETQLKKVTAGGAPVLSR